MESSGSGVRLYVHIQVYYLFSKLFFFIKLMIKCLDGTISTTSRIMTPAQRVPVLVLSIIVSQKKILDPEPQPAEPDCKRFHSFISPECRRWLTEAA